MPKEGRIPFPPPVRARGGPVSSVPEMMGLPRTSGMEIVDWT